MKIKDWDIFKMFKGKAKEVTKETTFDEMENVNPFEQIAVFAKAMGYKRGGKAKRRK